MPAVGAPADQLLEWAELLLAGRCMAANGFRFTVDWTAPAVDDGVSAVRPYGSDDATAAAANGYGITAEMRLDKDDPNRSYRSALSPERRLRYDETFFGAGDDTTSADTADGLRYTTSRTGCLADARRALYGDLDRWVALDVWASDLDAQIVPVVRADPAYRAALDVWRGCMSGHGFDLADPDAARAAALAHYRAATPGDAQEYERQLAVADAGCSQRSGLRATGDRLHQAQLARLAGARTGDAEEYRAIKTEAVRKAQSLRDDLRAAGGPSSGGSR
ncbi:hypothetical protein [Dactylosporangium sp. CA-139066]|uniref:hypothetical protein n=1 Tax=Dactylosporangium sp. CA-139066 TaxID=3239930 RepID=UPI003D8BF3A2